MTTKKEAEAPATPPKPRPVRIQRAINQLTKQRESAIAIRDKAAAEIHQLDQALLGLGWPDAA